MQHAKLLADTLVRWLSFQIVLRCFVTVHRLFQFVPLVHGSCRCWLCNTASVVIMYGVVLLVFLAQPAQK